MAVQTAIVTQNELKQIHDLQMEVTEKQSRLDAMMGNVRDLLFAKASVEPGRFDAKLVFRRMHNPAWKKVVIDNLGPEFAESIRLSTPTVTRYELLIVEHAIPPLWKATAEELGKN